MARLASFEFRGVNLVRQVFIETGTFMGETLSHAAREPFEELHSIEIYEPYYRSAAEAFAGDRRVRLHLGPSALVLPKIIDPNKTTTFWLDAHFQGNAPYETGASARC